MHFFDWLEHCAFSMWVKDPETLFGYNMYLSAHGVGMAILVGLSSAVALRILGFAPHVPLGPMERFFPVMFLGFWLNLISGVVLFIIYPLMPIRNPGFYIKIGFVLAAVVCLRKIRRQVFGNPACRGTEPVPTNGKVLAGALLVIWAVVITAGRLMAYHGVANVERQTTVAMLILVPVLLGLGWAGLRLFGKAPGSHAHS